MKGIVVRKPHERLVLLTAMALLLIPVAASAADQTVDVQVLAEDTLSIDVEPEIYLDSVVPGVSTQLAEFGMGITNTKATGWDVDVTGTDLLAYDMDCDEQGENCTRVPTGPTIDASAIYVRGGDQDNWGDPTAIVASEGSLTAAGTPFDLMTGTNVAYGSFGLDEQRPAVRVDVPGDGVDYANYYTTLTYTITASS